MNRNLAAGLSFTAVAVAAAAAAAALILPRGALACTRDAVERVPFGGTPAHAGLHGRPSAATARV